MSYTIPIKSRQRAHRPELIVLVSYSIYSRVNKDKLKTNYICLTTTNSIIIFQDAQDNNSFST